MYLHILFRTNKQITVPVLGCDYYKEDGFMVTTSSPEQANRYLIDFNSSCSDDEVTVSGDTVYIKEAAVAAIKVEE